MCIRDSNKTDEDIAYAIDCGIGFFIVDNREELDSINSFAAQKGIRQKILLRLTPGIDPHTSEAVNTGRVDSKFGTSIETGQAAELVGYAHGLSNVTVSGYHCHIGSQSFDSRAFIDTAEIMLEFIADMKMRFGIDTEYLNLGGGYGVRYTDSDPIMDIETEISAVADSVKAFCKRLDICVPNILMEPGRSIVADAGITLYTVGSVKQIKGYKYYISVDGGMTDNPRFALYGAKYTVINADVYKRQHLRRILFRFHSAFLPQAATVRLPQAAERSDPLLPDSTAPMTNQAVLCLLYTSRCV